MFKNYIYKDNLHHAYLLENDKDIIPLLLQYFKESLDYNIIANKDFYLHIYDNFKISNAKEILQIKSEKSFLGGKKFIVIYTNFFTNEAQNALLKMFEDTIVDTHFFVICPNKQIILPTLLSRFYLIKLNNEEVKENEIINQFINMKNKDRIIFIKNFVENIKNENKKEKDEEKENDESLKSKILDFINSIESILYYYYKNKNKNNTIDVNVFEKIIEIRKALLLQGSSPKMLFESLALNIPEEINTN